MKQTIALLLCLVIGVPAWCVPPADTQHAGQISALLPSAEHNSKPAKTKDDLSWNDLLKTEHTGRLRALLIDGSSLSMGSDTEMKVVQHDTASQQTSIQMGVGQLRSRVSKITNPNGKFEVKTPQAVIGVIGTDFYVGVAGGKTTVICYSGTVSVTPIPGAIAGTNSADNAASAGANAGPFTVPAGEMIVISDVPPVVQPTPASLQTETITATNVPDIPAGAPAVGAGGHGVLGTVVGVVIAGAVAGIAVGTVRNNPGNPQPQPQVNPCQQNPKACGTAAK